MGRTRTPAYRVEVGPARGNGRTVVSTPSCWFVNEKGRPTAANLEAYVHAYIDSCKVGGCNEHLSQAYGFIPVPSFARIVDQRTGGVVAEWKAPAFLVI